MRRFVYVGTTRWRRISAAAKGGLLRAEVGTDDWRHFDVGGSDSELNAIIVDPTRPGVLFAGTQTGLFRSDDQGEHWRRLPLPGADIQIWSILIHPTRPNVIFAGGSPVTIFRSEDGGESWSVMEGSQRPERLDFPFSSRVLRIAADPLTPDNIYASLEVNGTIRSRDGGTTWEDCSQGLVDLLAHPRYRNKIVVDDDREGIFDGHAVCVSAGAPGSLFYACRLGLFRSEDSGDSWQDMRVTAFSPFGYARDIRAAPQDPKRFYTCLSIFANGTAGSIWRSDDAGANWSRFDHSVEACSTVMNVGLDPADPELVCAVTFSGQVLVTRDGGASWREHLLPAGYMESFTIACG